MKRFGISWRYIEGALCAGLLVLLLAAAAEKEGIGEGVPGEEAAKEELTAGQEIQEPEAQETQAEKRPVDLMIFAGQSNMAGNGDAAEAPPVAEGAGYEFRAVTDPTRLYPAEEPFGIEENREGGIYDIWPDSGTRRKLGGLVPAFMNRYYEITGVPVVGVSASEGATTIDQWLPGTPRYEDLASRCASAKEYLQASQEWELRHTYLIWCQGESDGDAGIPEEAYYAALEELVNAVTAEGIAEKCMVIRIGNFGGDAQKYDAVIAAQTRLCRDNPNAVLISTRFAGMAEEGLMRDVYHYTQEGYNLAGTEAGENCGIYTVSGEEPALWDYEYGEWYEAEGKKSLMGES